MYIFYFNIKCWLDIALFENFKAFKSMTKGKIIIFLCTGQSDFRIFYIDNMYSLRLHENIQSIHS